MAWLGIGRRGRLEGRQKKDSQFCMAGSQTYIQTDGQKGRVGYDLSYLGAVYCLIRTVNTCFISRYSVVCILKQVCLFLLSAINKLSNQF